MAFALGFGTAALTQVPVQAALGPNLMASGGVLAPPQNFPTQMLGHATGTLTSVGAVLAFPDVMSASSQPATSLVMDPLLFKLQVPAFTLSSLQTPLISDEFMKWADANFWQSPPDFSDPRNNPARVSSSSIR